MIAVMNRLLVLMAVSCVIALSVLSNAVAAPSVGGDVPRVVNAESIEIEVKGELLATFPWGTDEISVGKTSQEEALYDFMSPTSFLASQGVLYVVDAPNHKLLVKENAPGQARVVKLEKGSVSEPNLYTDIALLSDGNLVVSSSREKLLYLVDPRKGILGKILPKVEINGITRIFASGSDELMLEDPESEKYHIIRPDGSLVTDVDIDAEPALLSGGRMLKLEEADSGSGNTGEVNLTAGLFDVVTKKLLKTFTCPFGNEAQNVILLGECGQDVFVFYVVAGEGLDAPSSAYAIKVDSEGRTHGRIALPEAPEMAMMRYIRLDGDSIVFAHGDESGFVLTRYRF
jgi:hypothetical protein